MATVVKLIKLTCKRCNHSWIPRTKDVRSCPKCKSPYWDQDRNSKGNKPNV